MDHVSFLFMVCTPASKKGPLNTLFFGRLQEINSVDWITTSIIRTRFLQKWDRVIP
jgi:hypothetical protein